MLDLLTDIVDTTLATVKEVIPIAAILFGFQFLVIRKPIPNIKRVLFGFLYVLIGLSLFLLGLERALFPLGKLMAQQLTDPAFIAGSKSLATDSLQWFDYVRANSQPCQ